MNRAMQNRYTPDYVSPPGETLAETLQSIGMSQAELAVRIGRAKKTVNEIVKGKAPITPRIALELESVLGVPAGFWNSREAIFREHLARVEEQSRFEKKVHWIEQFPVQSMVKLGWIDGFKDRVQQLRELLRFFQLGSPDQWEKYAESHMGQVAFRRSLAFAHNPAAVIAWLRKGEIEAGKIDCAPFEFGNFREKLQAIRELTAKPFSVFGPEVISLAAEAGVAVAFVPELPKTRMSAATRWLQPNKALIQLTFRYKSNDRFWFSFFHEAGHILLHGKRDLFVDEDRIDSPETEEMEANTFAENLLIPPARFRALTKNKVPEKAEILRFASEIGIAPGIVVGRLQRGGILPWNFCNDLKAVI